MDGFDFSSSTSAWKPDAKPIVASRHVRAELNGGEEDAGV